MQYLDRVRDLPMEWRKKDVWGSQAACPRSGLSFNRIVNHRTLKLLILGAPIYWLTLRFKGTLSSKTEEGAGLSLTFGFPLSTALTHKVSRFNAYGCQLALPVSGQPAQESANLKLPVTRWLTFALYCECVIYMNCLETFKPSYRYQKQGILTLRAKPNFMTICIESIHFRPKWYWNCFLSFEL